MRLEARCRQHPFRKIRVERFPRRFFCGLDVLQNIGSGMPFFFQDGIQPYRILPSTDSV